MARVKRSQRKVVKNVGTARPRGGKYLLDQIRIAAGRSIGGARLSWQLSARMSRLRPARGCEGAPECGAVFECVDSCPRNVSQQLACMLEVASSGEAKSRPTRRGFAAMLQRCNSDDPCSG